MKTILLATTALALAGTAAFAVEDDREHTRVRVDREHHAGGTVIEIRGEDGERTVHMQGDRPDTTLSINGQNIEIRDGHVIIDGEEIETSRHAVIIVDGDEVRVIESADRPHFDGRFERHMADRAEHMARMGEHMEGATFEFDMNGMQDEVMQALEAALAGLEADGDFDMDSDRWTELSDEERAEVHRSMREARDEIRAAMHEMRDEMREAGHEARDAQRHVHIEMRHAARDEARADRDRARVMRWESREDGEDGHRVMRWQSHGDADDAVHVERNVRVERDADGRQRVWVNDEEQTGDDLVTWLNQLQADRLAGGPSEDGERRVRRVIRTGGDADSGEDQRMERRVIVLREADDDAETEDHVERVYEFEFTDEDN